MADRLSDMVTDSISTANATPVLAAQVLPPENNVSLVEARVVARKATTGDVAAWHQEAVIKRGVAASSLVGTVENVTTVKRDAGASAWVATIKVGGVGGQVGVEVTGVAATTIQWRVELRIIS